MSERTAGLGARLPLTKAGLTLAGLAAVTYLAGWRFGWVELMVLTAACLLALVSALPFVIGRLRLGVTRELQPDRVTVGEPAVALLHITNQTKTPIGWRLIEDRIGVIGGDPVSVPIEVTGLKPGSDAEALHPLPTGRRGVVEVGPAVIAKADPLGLMRREVRQTKTDRLWVHPRVVPVNPVPVGFAKDLEGPTSDTSPAGDVAFHTLREYQIGDDHRHVHWLSSARAGTLMVRHYVDNRRPHLTVLLDDRASSYSADEFELAVEIAASVTINCLLQQQSIALRFGVEALLGQAVGGSTEDVLDKLSLVQPGGGSPLFEQATTAINAEIGTSALVIVTGAVPPDDLLPVVEQAKRTSNVLVVRTWPSADMAPLALPQATVFDIDSLDRFRLSWNRVMS